MLRHRCLTVAIAIAILGLAATTTATTAWADDKDATAAAKAGSESLVKAFNEHNTKALGELFTESADFAFLQGDSLETLQFGLVSGRDQITATVATFFQMYPSAKLAHTVRRARLVAPDVMVVDEDFEITGLPGESRPIKGKLVVVRVLADGCWKIAAERNISYDPPHKHGGV